MPVSSAKAVARSLRSAEQQVVMDELCQFESTHLSITAVPARVRRTSRSNLSDSTASTPSFPQPASPTAPSHGNTTAIGNGAAASTMRANRTEQTLKLMQVPFAGSVVHGERSALTEAQQVYDAVAWLRECPSATLRTLQQRVLCATETLFTQLVGMPAAARELLALSADPNEVRRSAADSSAQSLEATERAANAYVTTPPSLTFTEFLSTFLRETFVTSNPALFHGVLLSGRPQPAAPLSSLHLVYGLHIVEDVLRSSWSSSLPLDSSTTAAAAAAATGAAPSANAGLEAHQALFSEVVHWAHFFEHNFDPAREGFCRDPINFYVAVLLACAERGAWERRNTPDAVAEEAVRRLRLDDGASGRRPKICGACKAETMYLAESCRTYVRDTLRTMQHVNEDSTPQKEAGSGAARSSRSSRPRNGDEATRTRFFLATPAVVLWAAAFLRLYRLRTPVIASTLTVAAAPNQASAPLSSNDVQSAGSSSNDAVSSAEVYFIRDWIARAAKMDEDGFAAQEKAGGFVIPLSCATGASVAVFRFTQENVQAALRHISAWADAGVAANAALPVQELLIFLQDDFSVVPYYLSFFASD